MKQKTIRNSITIKGKGLHSGLTSIVKFKPAEENTGIVFIRNDVNPEKYIKGIYSNVENTVLTTAIVKDGIEVKTIEHLYSALAGLEIDNLIIEINGPEIPIMDGSSNPFIFALKSAGIKSQGINRRFIKILKEVKIIEFDKIALVRPYNGTKITFEIDYKNNFIDSTPQKASFDSSVDSYLHTISRARTFGFEKDVEFLKKMNYILGGTLDNAILVDDNKIINKEGLRSADEFVKHKLLDAIGDLYLLNHQIIGEYYGFKSGHRLNNMLLRALMDDNSAWEYND